MRKLKRQPTKAIPPNGSVMVAATHDKTCLYLTGWWTSVGDFKPVSPSLANNIARERERERAKRHNHAKKRQKCRKENRVKKHIGRKVAEGELVSLQNESETPKNKTKRQCEERKTILFKNVYTLFFYFFFSWGAGCEGILYMQVIALG